MRSNSLSDLVLLIPDKADSERDSLAAVWEQHGGQVLRLGRFWEPPSLDPKHVRVYGGFSFVLVLQQKLGFKLCNPPDDLILSVPNKYLRRQIKKRTVENIPELEYPVFIKSVMPKLLAARVYNSASEAEAASQGMDRTKEIFASQVVTFRSEARAFILNGNVLDCACYEGDGNAVEAARMAQNLAHEMELPRAVVVDLGSVEGEGWSVVEFNAAWGAGLNGCNAERVWSCIAAASGPQ